jgi:hypothetical protein
VHYNQSQQHDQRPQKPCGFHSVLLFEGTLA